MTTQCKSTFTIGLSDEEENNNPVSDSSNPNNNLNPDHPFCHTANWSVA